MNAYQFSERLKKIFNIKIWYHLTSSYRELMICHKDLNEQLLLQDELKSRGLLHQMIGICHIMEFDQIKDTLFAIQEQIYGPDGIESAANLLPELERKIVRIGDYLRLNREVIEVSLAGADDENTKSAVAVLETNPKIKLIRTDTIDDINAYLRVTLPDVLIILPSAMKKKTVEKLPQMSAWFLGTKIYHLQSEMGIPLDLDIDLTAIKPYLAED